MGEMLDYFDDKMNYLGTTTREEIHHKGFWHQTFHCWILRRDKNNKFILFQKRGSDKKSYPNTLDITAAGHLIAGEKKEDGLRELNEELGINAKYSDLIYLGIRMSSAKVKDMLNQEFAHVFLLEWNINLNKYKLQIDEVSGLVQIELKKGLQLFSGEKKKVECEGFHLNNKNEKENIKLLIGKEYIIPRIDNYYYKIFIMAERYFNNNKYICI